VAHYDRDPLLRRLELDFELDFELDGSPPLEPSDELRDRLELRLLDGLLALLELLDAVRRLPLDELAALERLELRDPLPLPLRDRLLPPLPLLRLLLRLLCDSRCLLSDSPCSLTSPSSIVPRHSPSASSCIIV